MSRFLEALGVASVALPLIAVPACAPLSSVVSKAVADAPIVTTALQTICQNLVPAAEATANALAKDGTASTIEATEANDIAPTCAAVTATAAMPMGGN